MSATIESLQVEVQSSAGSAVSGIDALASSLGKLKSAVKGGVGLTAVAKQLATLNNALNSISGANANNLNKLAQGLQTLSSCGNLKLSSSVSTQITNIGNAVRSLNGTDFAVLPSLVNALSPLANIGKANLNSYISQLQRLPQAVQALGSVNMDGLSSKLAELIAALSQLSNMGKNNLTSFVSQLNKIPQMMENLKNVDMRTLYNQIQSLVRVFTPLAAQMEKVSAGFAAFPARIQRLITSTNKLSGANNKAALSYVNLAAKIAIAYVAMTRIARVIGSWITSSNKYIEDMNLFAVSMGEYADEAKKYALEVGEVMGINPGEWMRNQGVFMTLTKGFGVASDRARLMSQNLTQLGYDLTSFYNLEGGVAEGMQKLQSGIAGELEPLRRLGYDLSVARLQQEALNLGITKSVNAMTQAEKAALRYYTIMKQVTWVQGDMARTLEAPANQLRILKAQVEQLSRALGSLFLPILQKILPYAIAVAKLLREIIVAIAALFNITLPEFEFGSGIGDISDGVGDIGDGLDDATKKAKKFKNALLGIDELNIISPPEDSTDGGSGGGIGNIGGGTDFPAPEYNFMAGVTNTVQEILDKLKEWLGLIEPIKSWADFMNTRLYDILTVIGAIAAGLLGWKIGKVLNGLGLLKNGLRGALGIALAVGGAFEYIMQYWNAWINGVDLENFLGLLAGAAAIVSGLALTFGSWGAAIGAAVTGIGLFVLGIKDAITNGLNLLNGILIPLGATLGGAGIGGAIGIAAGSLTGPIGAAIGAAIGLAVGLLVDFGIWLYQNWDEVCAYFESVVLNIQNFFKTGWDNIVAFVKDVPNKIINAFNALDKWVKDLPDKVKQKLDSIGKYLDKLPGEIKTWFSNLTGKIEKWFSDLWEPIKNFDWNQLGYDIGQWFGNAVKSGYDFVTKTVPQWFEDTGNAIKQGFETFFTSTLPAFFNQTIPQIVQTVADFFKKLPKKLGNIITSVWNEIVNVGNSIVDGLVEGLQTVWKAITDFVDGFIQGFKDALGIHSPSTVFDEIGVNIIDGLFNGIKSIGNAIATWFDTTVITPVVNLFDNMIIQIKEFFSNAWSWVKNVWSVATNWFNINVVRPIYDLFHNLLINVRDFFSNAWTNIKNLWSAVANWFNVNVVRPVYDLFHNLLVNVQQFFSNTWSNIKNVWSTVTNWFSTNVINPVKNAFSAVTSSIGGFFTNLWNNIKTTFGNVANWFQTNVTNPIGEFFKGAMNTVIKAINGLIRGINKISISVPDWVADLLGMEKGSRWGFNVAEIPLLASGGFVNSGQLFIARENGLTEMVGAIGSRSAVANNDQIVIGITEGVFNAVRAAMSGVKMNLAIDTSDLKFAYETSGANSVSTGMSARSGYAVDYDGDLKTAMLEALRESGMVDDLRRQADKPEQTTVQIGNRTITDAVVTQQRANGYRFVHNPA